MPTTISGSQITYNDSTTQSSAGAVFGTTWTNVTSSRTFGVTYTNNTGKYIQIIVGGSTSGAGGGIQITIGSITFTPFWVYSGAVGTSSPPMIVPPGATYSAVAYGSTSYSTWYELR
jgi:hypothetical protein